MAKRVRKMAEKEVNIVGMGEVLVGKNIESTKVLKRKGEGRIPFLKIMAFSGALKEGEVINVENFYKNTPRDGKRSIRFKGHLTWCNTQLRKHSGKFILRPVEKKALNGGDYEVTKVKLEKLT